MRKFAVLEYSNVTPTQLSTVQTQLDSKQAVVTGAATTITTANLVANMALVSDASGKVAVSAVPSANLAYVANLASDVQAQLNGKAALAGATFSGDVTVQGNLAVSGQTTTVNTQQLTVQDPVVVVNSGGLDQPSGVYIRKATGSNVAVVHQNGNLDFITTSTLASNITYTVDAYANIRTGTVHPTALALGEYTVSNSSGAFAIQKTGSNVLTSNGASTMFVGNVLHRPLSVGHMRSTGSTPSSNIHTITPADIDVANAGSGVFGGQLTVFATTDDKTTTNKSGYACASLLKSPAELEIVPLLVHRNVNLTTFDLGVYQGNVRVVTDAGCQVFWIFDGATIGA